MSHRAGGTEFRPTPSFARPTPAEVWAATPSDCGPRLTDRSLKSRTSQQDFCPRPKRHATDAQALRRPCRDAASSSCWRRRAGSATLPGTRGPRRRGTARQCSQSATATFRQSRPITSMAGHRLRRSSRGGLSLSHAEGAHAMKAVLHRTVVGVFHGAFRHSVLGRAIQGDFYTRCSCEICARPAAKQKRTLSLIQEAEQSKTNLQTETRASTWLRLHRQL